MIIFFQKKKKVPVASTKKRPNKPPPILSSDSNPAAFTSAPSLSRDSSASPSMNSKKSPSPVKKTNFLFPLFFFDGNLFSENEIEEEKFCGQIVEEEEDSVGEGKGDVSFS